MTDAEFENAVKIQELAEQLERLTLLVEALLRVMWDVRSHAKGEYTRIERELDSHWQAYLVKHRDS